jgi:rhodanese-related sulfurtransferase
MATKLMMPNPTEAKEYFEAKMQFTTGPVELDRMISEGQDINIIDVRAAEDYARGHIPCAINLPKEKWSTLAGLRKDKANILYCYSQTCHLAATAAMEFAEKGYPVMEMEGGLRTWKELDLDIEK